MPVPMLKPVNVAHKLSAKDLGADLLAVFIDEDQVEDGKLKPEAMSQIDGDTALTEHIGSLIDLGDFSGKWLQTATSVPPANSTAQRLLLVGAGKKTDRSSARARELGMKVGELTADKSHKGIAVTGPSRHTATPENLAQAAVGVSFGLYKYPLENLNDEAKAQLETLCTVTLVSPEKVDETLLSQTNSFAEATSFCRFLQDAPPNRATPTAVANWAKEKAEKLGLKTTIRGRAELQELGFGAMLAVSSGSAQEPQFVVIEYTPEKYEKTIAFVGKGLTMDAGGYSLKGSTHQVGMQYDMSGAAITLSSILPIAEQKLPVRVFAIAALCENLVDAHAYRVNDVLTTYSGKTVEIKNTDAEGRVVLCDALAFTEKELKPDYIFEYSTLTGAIVVALGNYGAGLFSHPDNAAAEVVTKASEEAGERVWQLPVWEEAQNDIKSSTIADLCNIGATAGSAGSSTAAAYLFEFIEKTPFAHIDVAGVAFGNNALGHPRKSGSGFGVQLNFQIAQQLSQKA